MLRILRDKKTAKRIWLVLMVVILPAFVLWGSGSLIRSRKEGADYAGRIFGRRVSYLEFQDSMEAAKNQAIIQFGEDYSEVQKYLNLKMQAWERLILLDEAKRRKIKVSDKEVVELITGYPFFQRKGRFDRETYKTMLDYVFRTQTRIFEEQTRSSLVLSKLYKAVTEGTNLTEQEIKDEYRKANEEISVDYIAGIPAEFEPEVTVTDEVIVDYFAKNSLQFKQPLSFNLEYASVAVDGDDGKQKIDELASALNKKEDFGKITGQLGLEVKETGLFTQDEPIPGIGWSAEILDSISNASAGSLLPPVIVDKRYYIMRMKEKKDPYVPDLESIKDKVRKAYLKEASAAKAKEKTESCFKKLKEDYGAGAAAADFDKAAKESGLQSGSTGLFKYGSYIEGIGASDNFWLVAEALKEGEFSPLPAPSGFYIIKLKSRLPYDEGKFQTEKPEFTQQVLARKKADYFARFIEDLKKKAWN